MPPSAYTRTSEGIPGQIREVQESISDYASLSNSPMYVYNGTDEVRRMGPTPVIFHPMAFCFDIDYLRWYRGDHVGENNFIRYNSPIRCITIGQERVCLLLENDEKWTLHYNYGAQDTWRNVRE